MTNTPTYDELSALCAQMAAALKKARFHIAEKLPPFRYPLTGYGADPAMVSAQDKVDGIDAALTAYRTLSPDPQWQRVPEWCVVISKEKLWLWRCLIGETDYIRARRVAGELDNLLGTEWNSEHPNPMDTFALVPLEPTWGLDAMSGAGADAIPASAGWTGSAGNIACEVYKSMIANYLNRARGEG